MTTNILIIESDLEIQTLLSQTLTTAGYQCLTASTGKAGLAEYDKHQPELVILDIIVLDSLQICQAIRARSHAVGILLITDEPASKDRLPGFQAGADDYLQMPFEASVVLAQIRALLRRLKVHIADYQYGDLILEKESYTLRRGERQAQLTATEYALLVLFMRRPERIISKEVLRENGWDGDDDDLIELYINFLQHKIGEPQLLHTVYGQGYILRQDDA